MSRALVTGATGLVGSHVVQRLLHDGWNVRAMVRDPARAQWLAAAGAEIATADLTSASSLELAASGCDAIVHAAALITAHASWDAFRQANVRGTEHVIRAAETAGARLVHVSSVAVYGARGRYHQGPTDERVPPSAGERDSYYARSKREAEALVMQAHATGRIWATAVRPAVIYGARDRQFVPRAARLLCHGVLPLPDRGRHTLAIVHAANVADGIARALGVPSAGGRAYNLANDDNVTLARFVALASLGLDRRIVRVAVPAAAVSALAAIVAAAVFATGARDLARSVRTTAAFLTRDNPFSSERARRELGWNPPAPADQAIPGAFRWWRDHPR